MFNTIEWQTKVIPVVSLTLCYKNRGSDFSIHWSPGKLVAKMTRINVNYN